MTYQRKIDDAIAGMIVELEDHGIDVEIGRELTVDVTLGDEGQDSWTRIKCPVEQHHIDLAKLI